MFTHLSFLVELICFLPQLLESLSKRPNSTDEEFSKKGIISKKNRQGNRFPCKSVGDSYSGLSYIHSMCMC